MYKEENFLFGWWTTKQTYYWLSCSSTGKLTPPVHHLYLRILHHHCLCICFELYAQQIKRSNLYSVESHSWANDICIWQIIRKNYSMFMLWGPPGLLVSGLPLYSFTHYLINWSLTHLSVFFILFNLNVCHRIKTIPSSKTQLLQRARVDIPWPLTQKQYIVRMDLFNQESKITLDLPIGM